MAMTQTDAAIPIPAGKAISFFEFVSLMACMMALTALSIDVMLPALPKIGLALGTSSANESQLIILTYVGGFAFGQLFFGPLSDRYGRKSPLLAGLALYIIASLAAILSNSFVILLIARAFQGVGAAGPRVIAFAIVRDKFGGRDMARVMSFVMMVFIVVPMLAPAIGQEVLEFSVWRAIFAFLLFAAIGLTIWIALRLEETRPSNTRQSYSIGDLREAAKLVLTTRQTIGYILTTGFVFGMMLSYITSAEQIFIDVYRLGSLFPIAFAGIAIFLVAAALVNASIVKTIGMRRVSHTALATIIGVCLIAAIFRFPVQPSLFVFGAFMASIFFFFGLMMPNFNALAMEPMGQVAGMASSIAGFYSTAAGAIFASIMGQSFDGSVRPLMVGISILGLATLLTVLVTERFKLQLFS